MRERYPTRQFNGLWQVLVVDAEDRWLDCDNQEEAMLLSQAMILCQAVAEGARTGHDVAEKLERAAKVMERHVGPNAPAANLLHAGAANARRQKAQNFTAANICGALESTPYFGFGIEIA